MSRTLIRFLCIFIGLTNCYQVLSQTSFKALMDAAYDSSIGMRQEAAISLLYKAKALKGVDTGYNESVNLYLGNNYEALNKMDSSIYYYGEALEYHEKTKDYSSLVFLYNRLGSAEINFTKRYPKAIDYFNRQAGYTLLVQDSASWFDCYNNIGIAYKLLGRYDSALHYFNRVAIDYSSQNASRLRALLFMADTYSLQADYHRSMKYYNQVIDALKPLEDSTFLFIAFLNKGDCQMKQKKFKESMNSFRKAALFITSTVEDNDKKELYHNLAYVYGQTGEYKKAFYFKNLEALLKDRINTASIEKASAEAEAKYGLRRNQDSLLISRQKLALADDKARERQRYFIIVLVVAVAIGLVATLAFRTAAIRKRANSKLRLEKQKVETLAARLQEADQTKAKLFSIISHDLRSPISSLYALIKLEEIKNAPPGREGMSEQITHLLNTLEDLLIWSKSQMDKFTLQPMPLLMTEIYNELIKLYTEVASERQITINNLADEEARISTDENLLKTILRNMFNNAIQNAPEHSIISLKAVNTNKGLVCSVSNKASESAFRDLENNFQQASLESGSNGLGLYLIKELVAKLNATTDLSYREGDILFQVYLPHLQR